MGILRDVLADKEYSKLSNMEAISDELLHKLQDKAEEWGATFIQFKLTDCAPTSETAPLVNAEAGVKLKMEALEIVAKDMGVEVYTLPPVFAAALIGVPLVVSIAPEIRVLNHQDEEKKSKKFNINILTGGE